MIILRKKVLTKIKIIIILLLFTICLPQKFSCENINKLLLSNSNSIFLIDLSTHSVSINKLYPTEDLININSSNYMLDVKISDNNIYVMSENYSDTRNLVIEKFNFNGKLLDKIIINISDDYKSNSCLVIEDCIYFINQQTQNEVIGLDFNGNVVFKNNFNKKINSIYNCDDKIIAASLNDIYIIKNNKVAKNNLDDIKLPIYQLDNSYFVDFDGNIYNISQGTTKIPSDNINFVAQNGTVSSNYVCLVNNNVLYALSFDGQNLLMAEFNNRIISARAVMGTIFVLTDDMNVYNVSESNLVNIKSQDKSPATDIYINSDDYYIDTENYLITQVDPDTSITQFCKKLSHNFSDLYILDGQYSVESRKICTGYIARFCLDNQDFDFTIIVTGDINKNGACNNADKDLLIDYLIGKINLDNAALISADINLNNKVNLQDLYLIKQIKR